MSARPVDPLCCFRLRLCAWPTTVGGWEQRFDDQKVGFTPRLMRHMGPDLGQSANILQYSLTGQGWDPPVL
eukprot:1155545-Pelagomonas_calceolata.AAC.6